MSTSQRICETCVYCSFAGNCDRYDKPLTSIEQPACDAYEIHPLLAENAKLRELVKECHELLQDLLAGCSLHPVTVEVMEQRMRELGIEVGTSCDPC